jgi:hypothetical protein
VDRQDRRPDRIHPALYRELEAWAPQELRSVNGQIEHVLQEAVARRRRAAQNEGPEPPAQQNGDPD